MIVSVNCREQKNQENEDPRLIMFCDKCGRPIHIVQQMPVLCLLDRFIKYQNQRRKDRNTTDHSNQNALRHNDSKISSECKCHDAKSDKSGNRCYRTSCYGFERIGDRMTHGPFFLSRETSLILFITIQKED